MKHLSGFEVEGFDPLVGAYILAAELGRTQDHQAAFARYEARMRPFAAANQTLALENQKDMNPEQMTARTDAVKDAIDLDAVTD